MFLFSCFQTGDEVKMSEEREVSPKDLVVEKEYGQEDIDIPKNDEHEDKDEEPRVS